MSSTVKYWQQVQIDGLGKLKLVEIPATKKFFQKQFTDLMEQTHVSDVQLQRMLLELMQENRASNHFNDNHPAILCLRCFISHEIKQVCVQIATKFGTQHGFSSRELFPLVLDDQIQPSSLNYSQSSYCSLAQDILQTFNSDRANLSTWVFRRVRHHPDLNAFLREHGVYLITDWAILNDTNPNQLQRILSEVYTLSSAEIEQACCLLEGYHEIYREDRWRSRQAGLLKAKAECLPPTVEQLTRIANYLKEENNLNLSNQFILNKLQMIASQLRQYRIYMRGGSLRTESLDEPETFKIVSQIESDQDPEREAQDDFLHFYRQQFLNHLDQAITQTLTERITYLQRKNTQAAKQFLTALTLFHCQGKSMGEIAPEIGLKAQYQVSQLIKLKEFRANIRQNLLQLLGDSVLDQAKLYANPNHLQDLDQRLAVALDEHISQFIKEAEVESTVAKKNCPLTSLFARRLCHCLTARRLAV